MEEDEIFVFIFALSSLNGNSLAFTNFINAKAFASIFGVIFSGIDVWVFVVLIVSCLVGVEVIFLLCLHAGSTKTKKASIIFLGYGKRG